MKSIKNFTAIIEKEADGYVALCHIIMQKKINNSTITVPVPNHPEIKIGTLQSIIRQSEIAKEQFESR